MKNKWKALIVACVAMAAVGIAGISYAIWTGFPTEATVDGKTGMLETYGFSEVEHNLSDESAVWVPYDQQYPIENMVKVWEIKVDCGGVQLSDPYLYNVTICYTPECDAEMRGCMYYFSGAEYLSAPASIYKDWTLIKGEDEPQQVKPDADGKIYVVFDSRSTTQMNKNVRLKINLTINSSEIVNGDFEDGDLTGWTLTGDGFVAVKSATDTLWNNNFANGEYNQQGNYHLDGWAGAQGEQGRGTLRSSDFTLCGTGKISFRLGGCKRENDGYISVKKADGTEVARFTNTKQEPYNGGAGKGEQYMWLYVYDLSEYLGETLHIEIVDNAGSDWGLLFVDDIRTYYTEEAFAALGDKDVDYFEAENKIGG